MLYLKERLYSKVINALEPDGLGRISILLLLGYNLWEILKSSYGLA